MSNPPPPLHLILLGPVNHVLNALDNYYPCISERLDKLFIQKSKYHGQSLEGPQCKLLLKCIKKLQIPEHLQEFEDVFYGICDVHIMCNIELLLSN